MATWAIGDVQGCWHSFEALLAAIAFRPDRDRLWLAGDIVNRGTGSLQTLRWVVAHSDAVTAVRGNHETGLLACAAGTRKARKRDTIAEILHAPDASELLAWVEKLPLLHIDRGYILVHAGLHPKWSLAECRDRAEQPDANTLDVLTRMRMLTAAGELDLDFAGPPEDAPTGHQPWFTLRATEPGHKVLFGHWAALGVRSGEGWQSLDGGCVWGNELAAFNLDSRQIVKVRADTRDLQTK